MARHIDAELALKIIDNYSKSVTEDGKVVVDAIKDIVAVITPTADVVPKREVERLEKALAAKDAEYDQALQDKARECNIAVDKICLEHREEIRALQEKHEAELAAAKIQFAREIFWEIDMLLTAIYLDDEDGTHFVGVDIQKYHALRKEIHEKLKTERTKRNESKNRI